MQEFELRLQSAKNSQTKTLNSISKPMSLNLDSNVNGTLSSFLNKLPEFFMFLIKKYSEMKEIRKEYRFENFWKKKVKVIDSKKNKMFITDLNSGLKLYRLVKMIIKNDASVIKKKVESSSNIFNHL